MVARKSATTMPFSVGRLATFNTLNDVQNGPDSRPFKRQRMSEDETWIDAGPLMHSSQTAIHDPVRGVQNGTFSSRSFRDKTQIPASPREAVMRPPLGASAGVATPPLWRMQDSNAPERQRGMTDSPTMAHGTLAGRTSGLASTSNNSRPSSAPLSADARAAASHNGFYQFDRHVPPQQGRAEDARTRSPEPAQTPSAVALLAKFKDNTLTPAEMKEVMRTAQMRQLPRAENSTTISIEGDHSAGGRIVNGQVQPHSPKPSHEEAAASRPMPVWRPQIPPMSSSKNGLYGPVRSTGSKQNTTNQSQSQPAMVPPGPVDTVGPLSHSNGTDARSPDRSPHQTLTTGQRPTARTDVIDLTENATICSTQRAPRRPETSVETALPSRNGNHDDLAHASECKQNDSTSSQSRSPIRRTRSPNALSLGRGNSAQDRRRRERQLEAAKRAEDALRYATDQIIVASPLHNSMGGPPLSNGVAHGAYENLLPPEPSRSTSRNLDDLPEPERRRLELVESHDATQMDAFIYGELNAPCRPTSRLFHILPEEHPILETKPARYFAHIDPRIHWSRPRSNGWYDAAQAQIRSRGNKKKSLGKVAARQALRKRQEASARRVGAATMVQIAPPERVAEDPVWMKALKELDDMAATYHAEQKAKASEKGPVENGVARTDKPVDVPMVNGDEPATRRSGRGQNTGQHETAAASPARSERVAVTKPTPTRRILRTKTASRPAATVEDADESESSDNDEDSTYGEGSGHRLRRRAANGADDHRMNVDTTPTRTRSGR
ncbi:hypothetical protein Micbo1qcDRAFT_167260 [Microdochium bolleyi]|uniref:Uncharacterized protein n=1 Tax=Microdochium bolleyi TaxID=196109 RepID=A0A136IRV7_9PEZI|nr:hypothetical protein Micbo1qcDRAFT_167260 [Microdochium bolleyi]